MAEKQLSMFGTSSADRAQKDGLVRLRQPGRKLTKAQQAFNRLVGQIESLRAKLERETVRMDKALAYFGEHLHPRLQRIAALRKDAIRAFAPYLDDKRLKGRSQKKILSHIIADQFTQILVQEGTLEEADLRAIFKRIHDIDFEKAEEANDEAARQEMESIFEDMGVHVDLSGLGPNMNEESFARRFAEIAGQIEEQANEWEGQPRRPRRKTRKQIEKEQSQLLAEELRKRSIATIYKQLVRALHPDLEQDAERRQQKTSLMQELTNAYRNNDLHTLLRLETEWIEREQVDLDRLTDEKLAVYNDVLKQQANDLRQAITALPYHPRYLSLAVTEGPFGDVRLRTEGAAEAFELDKTISEIEHCLARMRTDKALEEVKDAIRAYRRMNEDQMFPLEF